jgi:hypothetical protein
MQFIFCLSVTDTIMHIYKNFRSSAYLINIEYPIAKLRRPDQLKTYNLELEYTSRKEIMEAIISISAVIHTISFIISDAKFHSFKQLLTVI